MKNILQICQEVADLAAVQKPINLFDANDQHSSTLLSVTKSCLDSLMRYGDWQDLTKEATLTTAGDRTIYPIDNIVPDFYCILNNTVYLRDGDDKLIGAITPEQWMQEKYFNCPDADIKFKIQNNAIKLLKPLGNAVKIVFQYRSNVTCTDAMTFEEKSVITKNTDIPIFDEYLVKLGILWRYLKRNGMDYSEEYNEYEKELAKKFANGLATQDINLAYDMGELHDGVVINAVKASK